MSVSSDEINLLVYRYLQESGFVHSAFTFAYETQVANSPCVRSANQTPPGALIGYLQKGLQYVALETHLNHDGSERLCDAPLTLLSPHHCRLAQNSTTVTKKQKTTHQETTEKPVTVAPTPAVDSVSSPKEVLANGDGLVNSAVSLLSGHEKEVFSCLWNPKCNIIATGSGDSTARLWEIPSDLTPSQKPPSAAHILHHAATGPQKDVTTLEWNPSGSLLATGSYDGQARIWNKKGEIQHTFHCHKGPVFSVKWNQSSKLLLSASYDKTVAIWDANTGKKREHYAVHDAPILDAAWQNDNYFATCSSDKTIKICQLLTEDKVEDNDDNDKKDIIDETPLASAENTIRKKKSFTFYGHEDEVNAIKWDPSGRLLASCSDDHTVKIWDPTKYQEEEASKKQDISSNNSSNINSNRNSDSSSSKEFLHDFRDHKKEIYTIRWSPTGPNTSNPNKNLVLASASFDTTIKIWDIKAGKAILTCAHNNPVYAVGFSPNGDFLASGALNGVIHIWSLKDGSIVKSYAGCGDVFEISWNHTGDMISACYSSHQIVLLNFRS